ncbi:MAG TPA: hypothetical protein VKY32_01960 [Flavobacterium sp.]|nr:hypothetical protein [Flavobacterium sp.]
MKKYFVLFVFISHLSMFSQQLIIRFDEECHNENSVLLLNAMEDSLGEKRLKKIIKKGYKKDFIDIDVNVFQYRGSKISVTFDIVGTIIDVEFSTYDDLLTKRDKKKIRNYILENQTSFNVCWNNMYELNKYLKSGGNINTMREVFYFNLYREDLWNNKYRMRIMFPGYITQEFYNKYIKDLK